MKALKKETILVTDGLDAVATERDVHKLGNENPFITKLYCSFQNEV